MHIADLFSGDAFSVQTLTQAVNMMPTQYGRLNQMGLFKPKSLDTTIAAIEIKNNVINLIPSSPRGTAAPKNKTGKRSMKFIEIPRIALDDVLFPSDVQNKRAFGTADLQTVEDVTIERLAELARKHDMTDEYLKCGALQGIVFDADGSELLNLFELFNVTEEDIEFDFTDEDEDVAGKVEQIVSLITENISGDMMTGVRALCSPEFWDGLTKHPKVTAAYQHYQVTSQAIAGLAGLNGNILRDNMTAGFVFKGVVFEKYQGKGTFLNDTGASATRHFIAPGTARFFPEGTVETFHQVHAPADWMEAVNTLAEPRYAKVIADPKGTHADLMTESSKIPYCARPKVLVKGTGVYPSEG